LFLPMNSTSKRMELEMLRVEIFYW